MNIHHYMIYRRKDYNSQAYNRFRMYGGQADRYDVRIENYKQVYFDICSEQDSARKIRAALENTGKYKLGIGDVIAVNHAGIVTAYYVEADSLRVIPGFIRHSSGGAMIDLDTRNYRVKGKAGEWDACDQLLIDGKHFYLMESTEFRNAASFLILDAYGRMVMDNNKNGFDKDALAVIRTYMSGAHPRLESDVEVIAPTDEAKKSEMNLQEQRKAEILAKMSQMPNGEKFLLYQKYSENGMYERASESAGEQNYDMIDGNHNNNVAVSQTQEPEHKGTSGQVVQKSEKVKTETRPPVKKGFIPPYQRVSIILRLRQKQNEVAKKYGKPEPFQNMDQELALGGKR